MKRRSRKILTATVLCLGAVVGQGCMPEHEYKLKQVGGAEIPAGWDFSKEKQRIINQPSANGTESTTYVVDFSGLPEFAPFCGREVTFLSPLAIQRMDYVAGTTYNLRDYKPLPGGVVDLYCHPVRTGKLLGVRGVSVWESAAPGEKFGKIESLCVEALLEVQHPDAEVNHGKPLYLTYVLADDKTPPHRIRAPWKPAATSESPHALELFLEAKGVDE